MFDRGQVIEVYPEVEFTDDYGNVLRKAGTEAVYVRGLVQSAGQENITGRSEDALRGQEVETQIRFLCREFPAGPWARVVFDDREWDVIGEPRFYRTSPAIKHVTVRFQMRTAPPLPETA
jgi:hypothetical protein